MKPNRSQARQGKRPRQGDWCWLLAIATALVMIPIAIFATKTDILRRYKTQHSCKAGAMPVTWSNGLPFPMVADMAAHTMILSELKDAPTVFSLQYLRKEASSSIRATNIQIKSIACKIKQYADLDGRQLVRIFKTNTDSLSHHLHHTEDSLIFLGNIYNETSLVYDDQLSLATDAVRVIRPPAGTSYLIMTRLWLIERFWDVESYYFDVADENKAKLNQVRLAKKALDRENEQQQRILRLVRQMRTNLGQASDDFGHQQELESWQWLRSYMSFSHQPEHATLGDRSVTGQGLKTWFEANIVRILNRDGKLMTAQDLCCWWEQLDCE